MSWLTRRLDHLGSAAFGALGGLCLSQAPAFTQAYLQRLGGHIDEARRTVERMIAGEILPWLGQGAREQAVDELSLRLQQLQHLESTLTTVPATIRPLMLLRHADWSIARRTAESFTPAIPIDPASLLWTGIGIVAAAIAFETCKIPAWFVRRKQTRATSAGHAEKIEPNSKARAGGPAPSGRKKTAAAATSKQSPRPRRT